MASKVDIRHLRGFVVLAEELHFSRAAQRLFMTQSALTQTLHQLEQALNVKLFDRSTRSVLLSPAGASLLPYARDALAQTEKMEAEALRISRSDSGRLTVGCQLGTGLEIVPKVVRMFEENHPDYAITLKEYDFGHPSSGLDVGETDVAFLRPPVGLQDVNLMTLYQEARIACISKDHPLASRESVSIPEILNEPIIAAPNDGVWRDYWLLSEYRTVPANVVLESSTFDSELQAVAAGRGIIVTCEASRAFYSRPGVKYVDIEGLSPCDVALAWPNTLIHPAIGAFVATVKTVLQINQVKSGDVVYGG
jgi:DNA-binding transcriptional LysR family regulator